MKRKPSKRVPGSRRGPTEADLLLWDQICELDRLAVKEWPVASGRRWRYDFAFPKDKLAIEIDGAIWSNGRHTRGSGRIKEFEKFNMAALLGWQVLHFTPQQVLKGEAIAFIKKVLEVR